MAEVGPEWGPLAKLAGTWTGDEGIDVAYSHSRGEIGETKYREKIEFKPFGPVENGTQALYGLDYRMAAWRGAEENPFHTEVGYWLWDGGDGQVMRSFMVPRGSTILAGGLTTADATSFSMQAEVGSETYGILSNPHLARAARTVLYQVNIELEGDDAFSYRQTSTIEHAHLEEVLAHTDTNSLQRVVDPG